MENIKNEIEKRVAEASTKAREIIFTLPCLTGMNEEQIVGLYKVMVTKILSENL